jgi:hypothetical protein
LMQATASSRRMMRAPVEVDLLSALSLTGLVIAGGCPILSTAVALALNPVIREDGALADRARGGHRPCLGTA